MRIDWIIPAAKAEVSDEGTIDITGGGMDTLVLRRDVRELTLTLAMRIAGQADAWRTDHRVSVVLESDRAREQVVFEQTLRIPEAEFLDDEREIGFLVPAVCRWRRPLMGEVVLKVFLDGTHDASVPLQLITAG